MHVSNTPEFRRFLASIDVGARIKKKEGLVTLWGDARRAVGLEPTGPFTCYEYDGSLRNARCAAAVLAIHPLALIGWKVDPHNARNNVYFFTREGEPGSLPIGIVDSTLIKISSNSNLSILMWFISEVESRIELMQNSEIAKKEAERLENEAHERALLEIRKDDPIFGSW